METRFLYFLIPLILISCKTHSDDIPETDPQLNEYVFHNNPAYTVQRYLIDNNNKNAGFTAIFGIARPANKTLYYYNDLNTATFDTDIGSIKITDKLKPDTLSVRGTSILPGTKYVIDYLDPVHFKYKCGPRIKDANEKTFVKYYYKGVHSYTHNHFNLSEEQQKIHDENHDEFNHDSAFNAYITNKDDLADEEIEILKRIITHNDEHQVDDPGFIFGGTTNRP